MRIYILGYLFFLFTLNSFAQLKVKTYYNKIENGYVLFVDNNEPCPISIQIKLKLENFYSSEGNQSINVIPAKTKYFKITTLSIINTNKKFRVRISTNFNYGNHFLDKYDSDFEYHLPFQKGESYVLSQGYNGGLTHQNKNQLDFKMPIGTKIVAIRDGLVLKVVDENRIHCITETCKKFNNYIYVYHDDGTIAEYVHIKKQSSKVNAGDLIKQGQIIAESGNVGWSTGPHLHLSIFLQRLEGERDYVETRFKLSEGSKTDYLAEGENYTRTYD